MEFVFAVPAHNVRLVDPQGTIAICTLWTPPDFILKRLGWAGARPEAKASPVAVVGGLYGGGLKIMLRNLLYNPQVDTVLLIGKDYAGSGGHLARFFAGKVRSIGKKQLYVFADGSERELDKVEIFGGASAYVMDSLVLPEMFRQRPRVLDFASSGSLDDGLARLKAFLDSYAPQPAAFEPGGRISVPLPVPKVSEFPSDRAGHAIIADGILEAWEKLLFRLTRFGAPVTLRNGKVRNELLNMKVVIRNPEVFAEEDLARFNLPWDEIRDYQRELLSGEPGTGGVSYTYGNRMRRHFGSDLLDAVADDLSRSGDSRHGFITLWDNTRDIEGGKAPCLVTLFFRKIDERVHLTATFRSHNGTRAWPRNCFGLLGVLRHICERANASPGKTEPHTLVPGTLTVLSLSISVDPGDLDQVKGLVDDYAARIAPLQLDPYGYLRLSVDPGEKVIVVQQYGHDNELLAEYKGGTPSDLARQLCRAEALSDLSHALYLGGQLEKAYFCLAHGREYVQDKTVITCEPRER